jgi:hypothetical protein
MKHTSVSLVAIAAILFTACNNSSSGGKKSTVTTPSNIIVPTTGPGSPTTTQPVQVQPNNNTANTSQPVITTAQPVTTITQPITPVTTSGAGLNPEHGKPGHRCDIAVGAPLNSAPTNPTVTPTTPANNNPVMVKSNPQPVEVQKTFATNTPTTGAGLNPEHGKPGHRCDIAVGAPLDSKPNATPAITTSPVNNTPVTPSIAQPVTPILPGATNTTPGTAVTGLNPEHGKPGHRCDIAVGAPLNSKPVEIKKEKE